MSRRIDNPDGSFYGIAIAVVDPAYFTNFYGHAELGAQGVVSLLGTDGIEIARRAGDASTFGADMRESNLFRGASRRPSGTFLSSGRHDGHLRLLSYRRMKFYPLIVMLGVPQDEILAAAHERRRLYYLLAALASNLVVLVALGFHRSIARHRRDFEALTLAQARLRESDARSKAVTEKMAGGVVTTDYDGRVLTVNAAASRMFGYPDGEMAGMHIRQLVHESSHAELARAVEEAHAQGASLQAHDREFLALRRDRTCFEVEVLLSALALGGNLTYIAIVHDVSGRKALERAVRSREARYRATFDQSLVGVVYADLDSRITQANPTFCAMLGYPEKELLGRTFAELTHPAEQAASLARIQALRSDPHSIPARHTAKRYLRKDGSVVWVIVSISLVARDDGSPDYFLTMVQDISEIKRAEQMKNEFVSTVSHELRTPLTSIRGSLGLIAGGVAGALPAPAKALVAIADSNCERLIRLVNDILDTEKIASGKMRFDLRAAPLGPLVARAVESLDAFARRHGVVLRSSVPAQPVRCQVDEDRFIQVLTNLLSNAVKFSPAGMPVEISLSCEGAESARIDVRDHGPGIPLEFRPRVFQRFSQADASDARQKSGTGLGLSIAKGIVDKLGGEIGFRTTEGEGTTFFVRLPLVRNPDPQPLQPAIPEEADAHA